MKPDARRGSPAHTLRNAGADALVHDRVRLAVLTMLASHEELGFTELRDALSVTDGNLVTHLRRLEEAGYLTGRKETPREGEGGRPRSSFRLTRQGRNALLRYVEEMELALQVARAAVETPRGDPRGDVGLASR